MPTHLGRGPVESTNPEIAAFYAGLLAVLKEKAFRDGAWSQIQPHLAWADNWTSDGFVAYAWAGEDGSRHVVSGVVSTLTKTPSISSASWTSLPTRLGKTR